jgi:hypothetical protein
MTNYFDYTHLTQILDPNDASKILQKFFLHFKNIKNDFHHVDIGFTPIYALICDLVFAR